MTVSVFGVSLESGGRFFVDGFGSNLALITLKICSHFTDFINKLYKVCTSRAICEYCAAIFLL
jgi:hypothetical protein